MASLPTTEQTPEHVADIATIRTQLPRLALIGVFGSPDAPAALVRDPSGTMVRVTTGDTVARHTVAAIGQDHLVLTRGNLSKVLRLPQG